MVFQMLTSRRSRLVKTMAVSAAVAASMGTALLWGSAAQAAPQRAAALTSIPAPTPEKHDGNAVTCAQAGLSGSILFGAGGATDASSAAGSGDVSADGKSLDVTINAGWTASGVVVKGGPAYNVYTGPFIGPVTVTGFVPPTNPGGQAGVISHWFVCGTNDGQEPPPVIGLLTSEVHLDDTHEFIDDSNPATAPADVHDSVSLTVSGLTTWSGTVTVFFFESLECGNVDDSVDDVAIPVTQATVMPLEDVLPQTDLAAGDYSYLEFFFSDTDGLDDVQGPCEPFKVVDAPTTPTPGTSSLAVTGNTVGGVGVGTLAVAGAVLLAGGAALILFRRRRSISEG